MLEDVIPAERAQSTATFLFADIAGFTALTEAHGDEQAVRVVAGFCDAVTRELPAFGATHVKTIGDALMLRVPDPAQAVLLGLRIALDLLRGHRAPAVRVGLHHGPAIERDGDYFGATVNLAARVSAAATGGEVLLTGTDRRARAPPRRTSATSRAAARAAQHPRARRAGRRGPPRADAGAPLRDRPRLPMAVDPEHAAGRLVIDDTVYFFCSLDCAGAFARRPERFVD